MYASVSNAAFVTKLSTSSKEKNTKISETTFTNYADLNSFLNLTPKAYKQLTGKRLSLKESISLKMTQKMLKKQQLNASNDGLPKWAYIVLSIIVLGWLAIGVKSDWKGNDWWISLLLYFCFILPGIIYSLVVMKKYY
jgi:uncharacterized membrane protein YqaE (UPF0057 family)